MRLQLSPTQTADFARKVGSLRSVDLKTAIQMVLAEFAHGLDPFTRKDLTAVLREAGFPTDLEKDPEAWATVSAEIKRNSTNTSDKGFYTQASNGSGSIAPSRFAPPSPVPAATPSKTSELSGVEIKEVEGVFWSPLLAGEIDETYGADMGLRRIAVSQSTCFGSYSTRATACQSCPLASFCVQASVSNLPGLVATLDAATEASIQSAIRDLSRANTPSPIDEILGIKPKDVETLRPVPTDPEQLDLTRFPAGTRTVPISFDAFCTGCSSLIAVSEVGIHIPKRGLFHVACAKAVSP